MFLLDQELNDETNKVGRNSVQELNGDTHKGEQNSVPPGFTGTTVTLNNIQIIEGETKDFMEDYQRSITPASLSLYFYIAYQFIQEIPKESEDDKKEVTKVGF
jgi:hypothetical protein